MRNRGVETISLRLSYQPVDMLCASRPVVAARPARAATVKVQAAWQKASTKSAVTAAGGKLVAEIGGQVREMVGGESSAAARAAAAEPCVVARDCAAPATDWSQAAAACTPLACTACRRS
jgi:hypothetical protein